MMTALKAFIAFCLLAAVGTVVVVGPTELRRLLTGGAATEVAVAAKPETGAAKQDAKPQAQAEVPAKTEPKPEDQKSAAVAVPPAPSSSPAPSAAPQAGTVAETQKQVTAALADLAPVKPPPAVADTGPRFDVGRIDANGEAAVIAGRAAPGSKVELLRDGQPLDTVVADAAGQFVMTPPQLPAGTYELTLRAKAPDGTVTQSSRSMPVTIAEASPPPRLAPPPGRSETKQAEKPDEKHDVVASLPAAAPRLAAVPDKSAARPRMMTAPKPRLMARAPAEATVASASPADIFNGAPAAQGGSRVISRGDSLWALSRLAYGDGSRYALIFKANRDKIQNPNLIYPGQTFVLPRE
ncbi:LysM peptidoglycan-binding domain-containing protein [Bradyrhizobium sp.]|uniref:LysM peptidoglycan-binding domain-containing protein n=1 Tax=Bradyrhizobium sp. TaxID=376 RepID=UPI0039E2EF61